MLELWGLIEKLVHEPLRAGTIIAIVLFLIDRLFKQLFIRHVRKLLHIRNRDGVEMHMQKLFEIEQKLNLLLKERGIEEWSSSNVQGSRNESNRTAWKNGERLWQLRKISYVANIARIITKFSGTRGRKMKLNKVLLIPVLAAIATLIKELYGYEIGSEQIDLAATAIIWSIGAIGIFMHPHKKEPIEDEIQRSFERSE